MGLAVPRDRMNTTGAPVPHPEICPLCASHSRVTHTISQNWYRQRRHACLNVECDHRWWSYDTVLDPRRIVFKFKMRTDISSVSS